VLPAEWRNRLRVPVVAAPMTDVSGPELVAAACSHGVIGTFPTHNADSSDDLKRWLIRIKSLVAARTPPGREPAPMGVNLIVHRSNQRLSGDLRAVIDGGVEVVIASVGSPGEVVDELREAGVVVLADVASLRHVDRALASGVDGLVLLAAGAGGQTGWANPFAFIRAERQRCDGIFVLAGGVSDGAGILAAEVLGADLVYLGTRFIATTESLASPDYRAAVVAAGIDDITMSEQISGLAANVLTGWLKTADMPEGAADGFSVERLLARRGVWAAGHSVSGADEVIGVGELVDRLERELEQARQRLIPVTAADGYWRS
jgi:nitronate monooxygenase